MLALALGLGAGAALADGDPASDVLVTQPLFLPQDANLPIRQSSQLGALLAAARHHGYQIRVALIASSSDLGSVTELWRQPQTYARFLGEELSLTYRGPLLVVMPTGFGFDGFSQPLADLQNVVGGIRLTRGGAQFGAAVMTAVRRLAAKAGHPLPAVSAAGPRSSGSSGSALALIVFALGALVVLAAWAASFRARPLRARGEGVAST